MWDLSCPDWADRLGEGKPLIPDLPVNEAEADIGVAIFDELQLPDVPGTPRLVDACGGWFRNLVRAAFGSWDPVTQTRTIRDILTLAPKGSSKTSYSAGIALTLMLMNNRPRAEGVFIGPHAMLHAHGARPSGIISVNKGLDEKELVRLAAWVKKHYSGLDNVSRVMILDNDAKFTPFDLKGVDAQHIQLRNHEIESICHDMGVLPIVIGYPAEMAARAAAETLIAMHLVHTIRPWHRRFEKAFDRQLLSREDRRAGYYSKFIDGEFLRATAKDRAEYNKVALGGGGNPGWATINDVRAWDDMDEYEGGDHIYAPINAGPIGPDGIPRVAAPAAPPETVGKGPNVEQAA